MSRQRAAETPGVLKTLTEEHRYVSSLLGIISDQVKALETGGETDFNILHDTLHYLAHYPDDFHHPREDLIFDRMLRRDLSVRADVEFLLEDHQKLHRLSISLLQVVKDIVDGKERELSALKDDLDSYVRQYQKHMSFEEGRVFDSAREVLTDSDWEAVEAEEKYIEDPLFGNRVERQYRRLAHYLGDRFELATENLGAAEMLAAGGMLDTFSAVTIGVSDIGAVLMRRLRANCADNSKTLRQSLSAGNPGELMGLPFSILANNYRHTSELLQEISDLVEQMRGRKNQPFKPRMDYLKELIRSDWSGRAAEKIG